MFLTIIEAIFTALIPLIFLIIPGIFIARLKDEEEIFVKITQVILWSLVVTILLSLLVVTIQLPVYIAGLLVVIFACLEVFQKKSRLTIPVLKKLLPPIAAFLVLYMAFSVPFLIFHDGLPTGDSQKSIYWAEHVIDTNSLPDYSISKAVMNRDPVDFYTPGLHTYTALIMKLSAHPLTSIGFMAIALAIAVSFIGAGIAQIILPKYRGTHWLITFTFILSLTQYRFLRYIREPGYHLQNILGEVLLFGLLFLGLRLMNKLKWADAVLFILTCVALLFTHQLSTFLAAFLFIPAFLIWLWQNRSSLNSYIKTHKPVWSALLGFFIVVLYLLIELGLHKKITHIFTTDPHLLHLTLTITEYVPMMGSVWLMGGLFGLIILWIYSFKKENIPLLAFLSSTTLLFILSQGPRLGIDIPPVRVLFYSIIPLSITGSYFFSETMEAIVNRYSLRGRLVGSSLLLIVIGIAASSSLIQAYSFIPGVRTNSTLTGGQRHLISYLETDDSNAAVLIDDYNRRSSSWLLLSGNAMFTRIGADIKRQMNEADQSVVRYELYLKQLDYEKIFSMGSSESIIGLMQKHNIRYVTGISKTSNDAFAENQALKEVARADDITLYTIDKATYTSPYSDSITDWLLRPTTLVNNIGDRQDTFAHLPASLRSTRLSDPKTNGDESWRTTTSPYIPLKFSVGNYLATLYDQEKTGYADTTLELFIDFSTNNTGELEIIVPSGQRLPVSSQELIRINGKDAPWDEEGFINIILHNPSQQPVDIHFIALGLARTP